MGVCGGEERRSTSAMIGQATTGAASAALSSNNMWCRPQEMARQISMLLLFVRSVPSFARELLLGGGGEEHSGAKQARASNFSTDDEGEAGLVDLL